MFYAFIKQDMPLDNIQRTAVGVVVAPEPDDKPGQLGAKRDETYRHWDSGYGKRKDYNFFAWSDEGWNLLWKWEDSWLSKRAACQICEDAYFEYSKTHPNRWRRLRRRATDIYGIDPNDRLAGKDYENQANEADHIQDIAIRRVFDRNRWSFDGKEIMRIRHQKRRRNEQDRNEARDFDYLFSPGKVPFHKQELIYQSLKRWWNLRSIEEWYQSNKRLIIKRDDDGS